MKSAVLLATLSAIVIVSGSNVDRFKRQLPNIQGLVIPREFQNINFENYLKNPRAVQFQLKCVIYNGPCDRIGKYLKANLPNWLSTQCKNCNDAQKKQAAKAITFFQSNYPKEWNDAVKKYRGAFSEEDVRRFESELGIKVLAVVPADGNIPKPDTEGLAALARESIAIAKTTPEPLVLESRTPVKAEASSTAATSDAEPTTGPVAMNDEEATTSSSS